MRPLAPIAGGVLGSVVGGPAGAALGAGLFRTGDDLAHGQNIGQSLRDGAVSGATGYGVAKVGSLLSDYYSPDLSDVAAQGKTLPVSLTPGANYLPGFAAAAGDVAKPALPGILTRAGAVAGSLLRDAGSDVASHPSAVAGIGNAAVQYGDLRQKAADRAEWSRRFDLQQQIYEDERKRREMMGQALAQIAQLVGPRFGLGPNALASGAAAAGPPPPTSDGGSGR